MYKTDPEREIQNVAKGLINKWSRPIFELNNSYSDGSDDYESPRRSHHVEGTNRNTLKLREESLVRKSEITSPGQKSTRVQRAEAPAKTSMDFVIRPESNIESPKPKAKSQLELMFAKKKKPLTKGSTLGITKPKGRI